MDVAEVYSPPRVTSMASESGLEPGETMDILTGYDFAIQVDRGRARQKLREQNPNS